MRREPTPRRGSQRETPIMREIHDAIVSTGRALLWRNNTGVARFGDARVRYGLGNGGADLVGLLRPSGRFFALEVKTPATDLSTEQECWHRAVRAVGGFVACVRSVEEAMQALEEATAA